MSAVDNNVVLAVHNVRFSHKDRVVLRDINFEVKRGEAFAMVGASGSGTTSLLKICAGLLPPDEGCVTFLGGVPRAGQSQHAFVFQRAGLISNLGVYDNVALPLRFHNSLEEKSIRQKVDYLLEAVGFGDAGETRPAVLSPSDAKRVQMARALAMKPQVFFLDAAFEGLDPTTQDRLWNLIEDERRNSEAAVVLSDHHLGEMARRCNRVALLDKGGFAWCATAAQLDRYDGDDAGQSNNTRSGQLL